jgi:hypothetical protein
MPLQDPLQHCFVPGLTCGELLRNRHDCQRWRALLMCASESTGSHILRGRVAASLEHCITGEGSKVWVKVHQDFSSDGLSPDC